MTITRIKETKKGRYALFCGEEFLFSVDADTFAQHHITRGMELTGEQLAAIQANCEGQKALRRALNLLSMRDHASAELHQKLVRHFDPETAAYAVERVREFGYINDAAFAERYADELLTRKGASLREAANRMREKGLGRAEIEMALSKYDTDESAAVAALIEKKYQKKLAIGQTKAVFDALLRRGFSSRDIRAALRDCDTDIEEEF